MKRIIGSTTLATAMALALTAPASAATGMTSVSQARQEAARELAVLVGDQAFSSALHDQMSKGKASLADVMREYAQDGKPAHEDAMESLRDVEREAIRMRGLEGNLDDLFEVRMHGAGKGEVTDFTSFLTATIGKNPVTGAQEVIAYDRFGQEHRYPVDAVPSVPMLIVDTDGRAATVAGTAVLNETLRAALEPTFTPLPTKPLAEADDPATPSEQLTLLKSIYLAYDEEPDISGAAEVFAIVSGVGPDGKARITIKDMPWLDHDKRWYHPGQDLINWTDYGTNYVNVQLFEDDGDVNYKDLAAALISAVGNVATLVAPAAPEAAIVAGVSKIGETIVKAIPDSALRNDTDYLDSFYVIEKNGNYGTKSRPLIGAGGNARIVLEPYSVKARR